MEEGEAVLKRLLAVIACFVPFHALACDQADKVYDSGRYNMSMTLAVYHCSSTGEPSISLKHWICRTDLSEGDDKEVSYLPLCPGAKSEYERLMEQKADTLRPLAGAFGPPDSVDIQGVSGVSAGTEYFDTGRKP